MRTRRSDGRAMEDLRSLRKGKGKQRPAGPVRRAEERGDVPPRRACGLVPGSEHGWRAHELHRFHLAFQVGAIADCPHPEGGDLGQRPRHEWV